MDNRSHYFSPQEQQHIVEVKTRIKQYVEAAFEKIAPLVGSRPLESWIKDNFVVSGGITASLWGADTAVKDIDLYYRDPVSVQLFNNRIDEMFIREGAALQHLVKEINPRYMTTEVAGKLITVNAVTLINDMQIIRLGSLAECQRIFDFKHCLPTFDLRDNVFKISRNSFDSLNTRKLFTHHGTPKAHRLEKFSKRGWTL